MDKKILSQLAQINNRDERLKQSQALLDQICPPRSLSIPRIPTLSNPDCKLSEAIDFDAKVMQEGVSDESLKAYRSIANIFKQWVQKRNISDMQVASFTSSHAIGFLGHLVVDRNLGVVAWNNYLTRMKILFKGLEERGNLWENPFSKFKKKREPQKKRRTFAENEKKLVAAHIKEKDPDLFLVILLIYFCFIRPGELRRICFKDFNLVNNTIHLPAKSTKTKRNRLVTIPDIILPFFLNPEFASHPASYLVFGPKLKPHFSKSCHHNLMNNRH